MPGSIPEPLFTSRFNKGKRSFFFDVKKSKDDKPYLKITTLTLKGEEKQRSFLTVFESEVQDFFQAMGEATSFILKP